MQLDETIFTVVDTETTGTDPQTDAVVEIACWPSGRLDEFPLQSFVVNPGRAIPPTASAIHHITNGEVVGAPTLDEAWSMLAAYRQLTHCWVAHNAPFDRAFLQRLPGTGKPWLCTFRLARHLWPEAPGYSNQVLRYWLELSVTTHTAHRAADDVRVTAALLARELAAYRQLDQPQTLEGVLAFADAPIQVQMMPFGKHRGTPLTDLPRSYLQWALANLPELDPDLRWSLEQVAKGAMVG